MGRGEGAVAEEWVVVVGELVVAVILTATVAATGLVSGLMIREKVLVVTTGAAPKIKLKKGKLTSLRKRTIPLM